MTFSAAEFDERYRNITLRLTCSACPEQYDAFIGDRKVGYLRLRWGEFRVDYPDCGGEMICVEPDVFHAIAIKDTIDHDRQPLDPGLPSGPVAVVEDDRSGAVLGQLPFDCPQ